MPKLARTRRPRLTPAVMRRALMADRWVSRFQRAIRKALDRQVREVAREARIGVPPGQEPHALSWAQEMENAQRPWMIAMAAEGYDLAGTEFGLKTAPALGKATVDPVTAGVGASFLQVGDYDSIDRWVATTAAGSAATTASRLTKVYRDAAASRDPETGRAWTNNQIAQQIERRGLASNPARSLMLARTGSIWSMNEGAHQRYKRMGVTVERWVTTRDDARCIWCAQMHGRAVRTDDPFWRSGSEFGVQVPKLGGGLTTRTLKLPFEVQHPPLHPNCRCTMVPVITQEQAAVVVVVPPPKKPRKPPTPRAGPKPPKPSEEPPEPTPGFAEGVRNKVIAQASRTEKKINVLFDEQEKVQNELADLWKRNAEDPTYKMWEDPLAGELSERADQILIQQGRLRRNLAKYPLRQLKAKDPLNILKAKYQWVDISAQSKQARATQKTVNDALADLKKIIDGQTVSIANAEYVNIRVMASKPRADFYAGAIRGQTGASKATWHHEMGHWVEHQSIAAKRAAQRFLKRRTAGDRLEKLADLHPRTNYLPNELTRKDEFLDAYVGKHYDDGSTEVISMGLQFMVENPVEFAQRDPEHFKLIVDILSGRYRP